MMATRGVNLKKRSFALLDLWNRSSMRKFALLVYLWWKDPIGTTCRENLLFDEYEAEIDDIIEKAKTEDDVQKIFSEWFGNYGCPIDETIAKTILKILGRSN